jgi:GT2 family glycosyltransferase
VGAARNCALEQCRTDYAAFLDSDDRWHPEKNEVFLKEAERLRQPDLLFSDALSISAGGKIRGAIRRELPPGKSVFESMLLTNCVTTSTAMVKRSAWVEAGGFREDFHCPAGVEDWDFFLRVARHGSVAHIRRALADYRVHPESATQTKRGDLLKDGIRALRSAAVDVSPALRRAAMRSLFFQSAVRHVAARDGAAARRDLARAGCSLRSGALWGVSWGGAPAVTALRGIRRALSAGRRALFRAETDAVVQYFPSREGNAEPRPLDRP